ncbi:MAG: amino acid racemase [Rubrivivax sp.]
MTAPHRRTLGVLGGMGPLATVDFLDKLVRATPAATDQAHLPLVVRFCPEIPDRVAALRGTGASPAAALAAAARAVQAAGADAIVIPCHTAHVWADAVEAAVSIPLLHIAPPALAAAGRAACGAPVGLLASSGTREAALYASPGHGIRWIEPTADEQQRWVAPGILAVKSGRLVEATQLLAAAAHALVDRGAGALLLACTEIPIVLADHPLPVPVVDATAALAAHCVAWALACEGSPEAVGSPPAALSSRRGTSPGSSATA